MRAARVISAVAALTLAASCSGGGGDGSSRTEQKSSSSDAPSTLDGFYKQKPKWKGCGDGFQCTTVEVPLDYAKPSGPRLNLSLIRLPAEDPSSRVGSLFTNPGGPGGSGVAFARGVARTFGADLRRRFDIVGFDPRGVGASAPVRCMTGPQLDDFFGADSSPDDKKEADAFAAASKFYAQACKTKAAQMLPHVGTVDAAHDIDVLRAALGDRKLSYYGASYGTYLGALYAEQFPENVRALVLDGALDPRESSTGTLVEQAKGFETAFRAFVADCVKTNCPLGASPPAAKAKVADLLRKADETPLANTLDNRKISEAWVTMGIATALYAKESWPVLRQALSSALQTGDGTLLLRLADQLVERQPNGAYSNQTDANMAVNCVDKPNPPDAATYGKSADEAKKTSPLFGPFVVWGGLPCVYWPVQTKQKPKAVTAKGAAPILVIGTLRDPATPYKWAKSLASQLDSGVLLSLDGDGHTAYLQGNTCITRATDRYLISAKPPEEGTLCR